MLLALVLLALVLLAFVLLTLMLGENTNDELDPNNEQFRRDQTNAV